jgi:glycosyltransferase involved in cell wall biosynthesis
MNIKTAAKLLRALLPPACPVHLDGVTVASEALQLQLTTTAPSACCPRCAAPLATVHSRYQRHLTDLPWGTLSIRIQLTVRKFVCHHATCIRRMFTDRLPELVAVYARNTCRLAAADRIVALTGSERDLIAIYCPTAHDRVRVVGNGIDDCAEARTAVHRSRGHGAPLVLYTGRFVERKGMRELLEALPRVLERAPHTRFVLAGVHRHCSGEDMAQYWLPVGFKASREQVHFTGWLSPDQLAQWYGQADVLVVPSWYEPFGMVVLEGMLYGLPIAAAAVGGPAEILEHKRTGLLFPPRDAAALAHALIRLVEAPWLQRCLGLAAAREVSRTWLYPRVVERMRAVYDEVAQGRGTRVVQPAA